MRLGHLAMTAAMAASPALAQNYAAPTGSVMARPDAARIEHSGADQALQAQRMLASLSTCLADRYTITVRQYLDAVPGTPVEQKLARYFRTSECIEGARMRIETSGFREALFAGMYLRDYGRIAPPALPADVRIDYAIGKTSRDEAHVVLMQFGDCVNRTDMTGTRAFLLAPVGTPEEGARIAALGPALSDCLAPGAKLSFGRAALRGYLSEAAYRLAKAAPVQTAAKAN